MRAFIAGATGVLGTRLVDELTDRGHDVVGLARDDAGERAVERRGGNPRRRDVLDRASLVNAADGADVIVHAATAIPKSEKPTDEEWERNDRVRLDGARNLAAVADEVDADRLLLQSIVWVARQPDGSPFDEDSPPKPDRITRSAVEAEDVVTEAAERGNFDASILRCGWFYAPDTYHTRTIGQGVLGRQIPVIGTGLLGRRDATLSYLHVDDAARAFADAAEADETGLWHVVDDEPASFAAFLQEFAAHLDAPDPRRIPAWLARFLAGEGFVGLVTNSMPTSNERFRKATGWEPRYPTYQEGLAQVVETWREKGTLVESGDGYEWRGGP
jgi:nucleoside-diphosphate-sugar epimerase